MSDGSGEVLSFVFLGVALVFALILWIERRPAKVVIPDEPYGDASDTPTMIHNTRRANWKRGAD